MVMRELSDAAFFSTIVLSLAFLVAGVSKLRDLPGFIRVARSYQILPDLPTKAFAPALPFVEVTLGLSFLVGLALPITATASVILLSIFTAAILINIRRGRKDIPCACFGSLSKAQIGWFSVARNTVLVTFGALLIAQTINSTNVFGGAASQYVPAVSEALRYVLAFMAALCLFLLLAVFEQIFSFHRV